MVLMLEPASYWMANGVVPPLDAFHVEKVVDPFTQETAVGMVRHAGHAFRIDLRTSPDKLDDGDWRAFGFQYLASLQSALGFVPGAAGWLHSKIFQALDPSQAQAQPGFGWLDVSWRDSLLKHRLPDGTGPLGSFRVDRTDDVRANLWPRVVVLMAGAVDQRHRLQLALDVGLRIVIQVHSNHVRIHGVTLSGLSSDRALQAIPTQGLFKQPDYDLRDLKQAIGKALDCSGYIWIGSLERPLGVASTSDRLSASGFALKSRMLAKNPILGTAGASPAAAADVPNRSWILDFRVDVERDSASEQFRIVHVHRNAFVGSAANAQHWRTVRAFLADPASQGCADSLRERRPTRSQESLEKFESKVRLNLSADGSLRFSDAGVLFETRGASRAGASIAGSTVAMNSGKVVQAKTPASKLPLRSDERASVETHVRAADLFGRFRGYGIEPGAYFRFARLPLVQRARPSMRWAPDGELPNAEVRPFIGDLEAERILPRASDRMQLLVKYGSADPMHRSKRRLPGSKSGREVAQYLSVACDPRWAWHEFGHVLNFASTGELEFPFAHSAGDALGAIAADPLSQLATAEDPEAPIRFVSFPWIEVPGRSHGRSPLRGYCWCGQRNLVRLNFSPSLERYHHSYFGEQLLSSSLFRLYRSLGGDTRGASEGPDVDEATRLEASDYCIYLIMRAISLLGPDSLAPARTPDQFVSALIDADLSTGSWAVVADWPLDRDIRTLQRYGGRVHKVIRWAFERQGLYATPEPTAVVDAQGLPPAVDVFIADQRPSSGPDGEPGGYAPVPLRFSKNEVWHAEKNAIKRIGQQVEIVIRNRGLREATSVSVRLWCGMDTGLSGEIRWSQPASATVAGPVASGALASSVSVALPEGSTEEPSWILVSVDSPADPSNLPLGQQPLSATSELLELVAHDNNLALTWK